MVVKLFPPIKEERIEDIEVDELSEEKKSIKAISDALARTAELSKGLIETAVSPDIAEPIPIPDALTFYSVDEAKRFGVDLDIGWQLKAIPSQITKDGILYDTTTVSLIDPFGWEHTQDNLFISPEGTTLTLAQVEAIYKLPEAERIKEFPTLPMPLFPTEIATGLEAPDITARIAELETELAGIPRGEEINRQLLAEGKITPYEITQIGELEQELKGLKTQQALRLVFPEKDLAEIIEYYFPEPSAPPVYPLPEEGFEGMEPEWVSEELRRGAEKALATERWDEFLADIVEFGRKPETEAILQSLGFSDADLDGIFQISQEDVFARTRLQKLLWYAKITDEQADEVFTTKGERGLVEDWVLKYVFPKKGKDDKLVQTAVGEVIKYVTGVVPPPNLFEKAQFSWMAGLGDVVSTAAGTAGWLGWEGIAENLSNIGADLQENRPPSVLGEFDISDLANPEFYATKVTQTIPFALALAPLVIGGFYAATGVASAVGLGTVWSWIVGSVASGVLSRSAESALEAGSQYQDAIARGKSGKEARVEANQVFKDNMVLAGADAWEIAIALAPTPKWIPAALVKRGLVRTAIVGGKTVIVGLSEGGEEIYQDMVQRHARGEEWKLDPISKEVFAIGAIIGMGMGLGGAVISNIVSEAKATMPTEIKADFDKAVSASEAEGFRTDQAELKAVDVIAQTPEGGKIVGEAIETAKEQTAADEARAAEARIAKIPAEEVAPPLLPTKEAFEALLQANLRKEGFLEPPTEIEAEVPVTAEVTKELTVAEGMAIKNEVRNSKEYLAIKKQWEKLKEEKGAGSSEALKLRDQLVAMEDTALEKAVAIPKAEVGMPEAGYQPAMVEGVTEKEVRPAGKGRITQISMEDQLKLEQARRAAEEAPEEAREAYEAQEQIAGLEYTHESDPVAQARFKLGGKNVDLTAFISIKEQNFPDYFTVKQAQAIRPYQDWSHYTQKGTKDYNRIPRVNVLDELADKWGMTSDQIADRVMQIRRERRQIKQLKTEITTEFTKKPLTPQTDLTPEEVKENWSVIGQPKFTLKQIDVLAGFFADYINDPTIVRAWELTRELRRETRAGRAEILKARAQELIVSKGINTEEAMNQAIRETLSGELPAVTTEYFEEMTNELRGALFDKVYHTLKNDPYEMASTVTALTNALTGKPIPREVGVKGGSAYTRLQRVFGDQPKVLKAIDRMASDKKPLEKITEAIYHEIGRDPIPIDQGTADYLRGLKTTILYEPTVFREPIPVTKFEAPIEDVIKQMPMFPRPVMDNVIRVLKEIGWSPIDIGNFLRANKASFDFSFWRQQAPLILNHPVSFVQANIDAWKAMWSQKSAEASWQRIIKDPVYQYYDQAGHDFLRPLTLRKGTSQWRGVEEFGYLTGERLIPRLTEKIPYVKVSARAFVTGTNTHNWRIFKNHYNAMLKVSEKVASGDVKLKVGETFDIQKEMTDFGRMLADFTGRAELGKAAPLAPALGSLLFAPRLALARLLTPRHLVSANPRVRMEAWRNIVTFVGGFGGLVLLGNLLDLWDVERDPRSADYMSIRIGNTRIDVWGGYRQYLVFLTRAITGTGLSSVTGQEYKVDPLGSLTNFVRGKASPLASIITDFWTGKTFIGEEVDVTNKKQWIERIAPFAIMDIYEAYMDDPTTAFQVAIPAIVGAGVSTYTGDWVENWVKLGLPKYSDNLPYGLTEPKYDTQDFWADTASQFKGVDPATLTKAKGFPEYIRAIVEARAILEYLNTLPSERLVSLNADPTKGTTFADYYQMWRDRQKIVASGDEAKLKEFDEKYPKAEKGNFSQRQFALLNEYWAITDKKKQAEFLEKHKDEIGTNLRQDYLRTHPKENAQLAIWGQADILTKKAYDEFKKLVKELDIPDSAIPEMTLPPEGSVDTHFKYLDAVEEFGGSSVQAQLILAQDDTYREWKELEIPDMPLAALELRVKHDDLYDLYDSYGNKESPNFLSDVKDKVTGLSLRDEAQAKLKADNLEWVDDTRRIEAIKNLATPDTIEEWVDRGKTIDKFSAGSSEAMVWLIDHPDTFKWALDQKLLTDDGKDWNVPVLRINVKWREWDDWYDAIKDTIIDGVFYSKAQIRATALKMYPEYAKARKERDALRRR